jgi:hypothetical protein
VGFDNTMKVPINMVANFAAANKWYEIRSRRNNAYKCTLKPC